MKYVLSFLMIASISIILYLGITALYCSGFNADGNYIVPDCVNVVHPLIGLFVVSAAIFVAAFIGIISCIEL
jgi:hypothetical protein